MIEIAILVGQELGVVKPSVVNEEEREPFFTVSLHSASLEEYFPVIFLIQILVNAFLVSIGHVFFCFIV